MSNKSVARRRWRRRRRTTTTTRKYAPVSAPVGLFIVFVCLSAVVGGGEKRSRTEDRCESV
jgi:hypothetical protein